MSIVYKTTNLINGMIYVGVHDGSNPNYLGSGIKLRRAINKYGRENFVRETVETFLTEDAAYDKEEYYIDLFDARNPEVGYNIAIGGNGGNTGNYEGHKTRFKGAGNPMYGKHQTNESKAKASEGRKRWRQTDAGIQHSEQHRLRFLSDENPGKNKSSETRARISKAKQGKPTGPRTTFHLVDPYGNHYKIDGDVALKQFCKDHSLSHYGLVLMMRGKPYKTGSTVGWTARRV